MRTPSFRLVERKGSLRTSIKRSSKTEDGLTAPVILDSIQTSVADVLESLQKNSNPPSEEARRILRLFAEKQKFTVDSLVSSGDTRKTRQVVKILTDISKIEQLLSLVNYFDDHILTEIFLYAFQNEQENIQPEIYPSPPSELNPPLQLSHVCRRWRNLVLSMPELWSSINLALNPWGCAPELPLVEMFLKNSEDYPLKISFTRHRYLWQPHHDTVTTETRAYTSAIFPHSDRWETLVMDVMIFSQLMSKKYLPAISATWLKSITLTSPLHLAPSMLYYPEKGKRVCGIWESTPSLETFAFIGMENVQCTYPWTVHFRLPANQITTLNLEWELDVLECLQTLHDCYALVSCTMFIVDIPTDRSAMWTGEQQLRLRATYAYLLQLEELILFGPANDTASDAAFQLLDYVTVPLLRHLTIAHQHRWRRRIFDDFLKRSLCAISRLCLHNVFIPEDHLLSCLQHVDKSLTMLHITSRRIDGLDLSFSENIIRRMSYDPDAWCLPLSASLQQLELNANVLNARDGMLAEMVRSRWRTQTASNALAFTPIKTVFLSVSLYGSHVRDITGLIELEAEGKLQLTLDENCPSYSPNRKRHCKYRRTKLNDEYTSDSDSE